MRNHLPVCLAGEGGQDTLGEERPGIIFLQQPGDGMGVPLLGSRSVPQSPHLECLSGSSTLQRTRGLRVGGSKIEGGKVLSPRIW